MCLTGSTSNPLHFFQLLLTWLAPVISLGLRRPLPQEATCALPVSSSQSGSWAP